MKAFAACATLLVGLICCPSTLRSAEGPNGQAMGTAGVIDGTVLDPSGASVAGAQVVLKNPITSYQQETTTDANGVFHFVNIPPHQYQLQITAQNFQAFATKVSIHGAVPVKVQARLDLASSSQEVTVEASGADLLETVPTQHTDADQNLIQKLPLTSASQGLSDAITLTTPGVVADSNGSFHPLGDHAQTSYVIDGMPINDQQSKSFSTQLPANAFQSLELVTGAPSAEYGDKTSLVVNAVTRSGLGHKPTGSLDTYYGSFGTYGEEATFGFGSAKFGNFVVANSSRTARFLDTPEFTPFHDKGTNATIFDRIDYQPTGRDSTHLDIFGARNWFQIPNTYDQLNQDQRQRATTFSVAPGYQHTFSTSSLLTINPFFRQDRIDYWPSRDEFDDTPATVGQNRHLTNFGVSASLAWVRGIHNVKLGTQITQTQLKENFNFGLTDPLFNAVCVDVQGNPLALPSVTNPASCDGLGYMANPNLSPGLIPYDLTRGGSPFLFHGNANINQQAVYAQDQITWRNWTFNLGLRFDNYDGISTDNLLQPRAAVSYLIKPTNTVLKASYTRSMETPYNENLVLSSSTGAGGLAGDVLGGSSEALRPGHRNEYNTGLQQALGHYLQIDGSYFWKFTKNAYDFDTLFNTPITFPISWRQSKIDGVSLRLSTPNLHGFQAYTTLGHTRARFFGPETGGLVFNSAVSAGVFRIDHDQALQQTTDFRYQYKKDGPWIAFTWRFDSGEVAGAVATLDDVLALTPAQQSTIGFYCGADQATVYHGISSCGSNYGATRVRIPEPGTYNEDHNPPRIAPRNLFDVGVGTDNLFHYERFKTTLKLQAVNITNEAALYNFLSTFSGTHWVSPRTFQLTMGFAF
ncbi:MAG TPA: TonB-dependent receptor [Bryobacteraceae bacterium]|nr:TonB-dependent receptor [Bryobacteraceae bacterium]